MIHLKQTTDKSLICFGIISKTPDNKHVVFIDSDIKHSELDKLISTLKHLQFRYRLSNFYIIKSQTGFNGICLDKFELSEIYNMLIKYDIIDELFTKLAFKRGYYVIRTGNDKEFCCILESQYHKHEKSNAHRLMIKLLYEIDVPLDNSFDLATDGLITAYRSEKHGYADIEIKDV